MPLNIDNTGTAEEQAKVHPKVRAFMTMTPQEVSAYIDANVTNLAEAKDMMQTMGMLIRVIAEEVKNLR